ncbi:MAG: hypothetical protein R2710_25170 [Acidimicrobiales bacterium]
MTERRRTHRSHLSYIDKSREYYAAHGYEKAYEWATNDDAPFTPLSKPLSECKVGAITTSYFLPEDFVYRIPSDLPRKPHVAARSEVERLNNQHLSWAKDETTPRITRASCRWPDSTRRQRPGGSVRCPTGSTVCSPSSVHRQTQRRDTPQLIEWLQEDEVDVVLMIPL